MTFPYVLSVLTYLQVQLVHELISNPAHDYAKIEQFNQLEVVAEWRSTIRLALLVQDVIESVLPYIVKCLVAHFTGIPIIIIRYLSLRFVQSMVIN